MSSRLYLETLKSPSDVSSRSVSPVVLKPMGTPTPHLKQRSSSVNSMGSAHLAHQRSMSIVSMESPRNLIVSVDDFFLKPTRNNSTSSLASLGISGSPLETSKDGPTATNRLPRPKARSACAIMSDEESSDPEHIMTRSSVWGRRRSSEKVHKPDFLLSFKNNFKFKYDSYVKPKQHVSTSTHMQLQPHQHPQLLVQAATTVSSAALPKLDDSMPSPLSSALESPHHQHHYHQHGASIFNNIENEPLPPAARPPVTPTTKKVRSSSMTQSMFLKRKLLLSKDIQFELLSSHTPTPASFPAPTQAEIRSPSHFLSPPGASRVTSHYLPQHVSEASPSSSSPSTTTAYQPTIKSPSPLHGFSPLHLTSPSSSSPSPSSSAALPPTEQTLRQQNKFITELNRKWNRAMYLPSIEDYSPHEMASLEFMPSRMKKRGRSELSSSTDSLATNY